MLEGLEGDGSEDPVLKVSMVRDKHTSMTIEPANVYILNSQALPSLFISGECALLY